MQDIRRPVKAELEAVNQLIISNLASDVALVENIGNAIVTAGGKRLRPLLVLLAGGCCGHLAEKHIRFAAVVEFIHTATLLHDDVVDLSTLRRGHTSANAEHGNAASVLVGDFLYTRAFQLMVEIGDMDVMRDMAAATNLIAAGEVVQLVHTGDPETSEAQYLEVVTRKTATLFASACADAAVLSGQSTAVGQLLRDFGMNVGMAFQIIDDVLDYEGDPAEMGKNATDDLSEGKVTLPLIHVLRNGNKQQRALVTDAIRDRSNRDIDAVIAAVASVGSLDHSRGIAQHYRQQALQSLQQLPDNPFRTAMAAVAQLAIKRTH